MAETIGNANISITVALAELIQSLDKAMNEVNNAVENMNKDIVLNVDTKVQGELKEKFNVISEAIQNMKSDLTDASGEITENVKVIDETLVKTGQSFTGMAAEAGGAMGGVGALLVEFAAPITVAIAAVVVLAVEVAALIGFILDIKDRVKEYASENSKLKDAIETVVDVLSDLWDGMVKIYDMVVDKIAGAIADLIEGFIDTWDEMNNTTEAGDNLLDSLKNLMSSGFKAVASVVDSVIRIFSAFSGQSGDSKDKVDNLSTAVNTLSGFFNALAFVAKTVSDGFKVVADWAVTVADKLQPVLNVLKDISGFVASIPGALLGGIFGGFEAPPPEPKATQSTPDIDASPTKESGKKKSTGTGTRKSNSSEKVSDPEKIEADAIKESNDEYEKQLTLVTQGIQLGENSIEQKWVILDLYLDHLNALREITQFEDNIFQIDEKINSLKIQQNKELEDRVQSQQKLIEFAGKESESIKEKFRQQIEAEKRNMEAEKQLQNLKINNTKSIQVIEINNINEKYRREKEKINQSLIDEKLKIQIVNQLEITRVKEVTKIHNQETESLTAFLSSKFSEVIDFSSVKLKDVFTSLGENIRAIFRGIFDEIMRRLLELAASAIFKSILKILSPGGGGLFGFLGSLFDRGGYTGDGPEDEIAGAVHRKEFVVNALGTSIPGNRELLEAANQGVDIKSLLGSAESGRTRLEGVKSGIIQSVGDSLAGSNDKIINISIDGVNVNAKIQKLTGLSESDWINIVDEELIPQLSKGLKRVGLPVLDNSIKN